MDSVCLESRSDAVAIHCWVVAKRCALWERPVFTRVQARGVSLPVQQLSSLWQSSTLPWCSRAAQSHGEKSIGRPPAHL